MEFVDLTSNGRGRPLSRWGRAPPANTTAGAGLLYGWLPQQGDFGKEAEKPKHGI